MDTIEIKVTKLNMESYWLTLNEDEVTQMYNDSQKSMTDIKTLKEVLKNEREACQYLMRTNKTTESEIEQANILLTALGVVKTKEQNMTLTTRIAIYATQK